MDFLSPTFLWLIPLSSIPIILHLLNKRNIVTINFSSIYFLKQLEKDSIKKIKLIQIILLILRTLIIFLIVIMISRPTLNGLLNVNNSNDQLLHVIILDNSFSMQGRDKLTFNSINNILHEIPNTNPIIWINTNGGIQYEGAKEDMPDINNLINNTYLSNNLNMTFNLLRNIINNNYLQFKKKELYFITDANDETVNELNKYFNDFNSFNKYIIYPNIFSNNLSIIDANVINNIILPNQKISISTIIQNNGDEKINNRLVQLLIDDMVVGQQLITLDPNTENEYYFNTILPTHGKYKCSINIDKDERNQDNIFYFIINIPNNYNITLVGSNEENSYYLKESLKILNDYGETFKITEILSLNNYVNTYNESDIIIILKPEELQFISDSMLEEYISSGGHVILYPNPMIDNNWLDHVNNLSSEINENYTNLIFQNNINSSYQPIDQSTISIDEAYKILTNTNSKENVRFYKYLKLPFNPSTTQIQLNDRSSIWNRYYIQSGIIDIFSFALNLNWTNFPIKGSFIPFNHFLLYSLSKANNNNYLFTDDKWIYIDDNYYINTIYHNTPTNIKKIIIKSDNMITTQQLNYPGFHKITSNNQIISEAAININKKEFKHYQLSKNIIKDNLKDIYKILSMNDDISKEILLSRYGLEMWRYILILITILLLLEMYLSNVKQKN